MNDEFSEDIIGAAAEDAELEQAAAREARLLKFAEEMEAAEQPAPVDTEPALAGSNGLSYPPPKNIGLDPVDMTPEDPSFGLGEEDKPFRGGAAGAGFIDDAMDFEYKAAALDAYNGFFKENRAGLAPARAAVTDVVHTFRDVNDWVEENHPVLKGVYMLRDAAGVPSLPSVLSAVDDEIPQLGVAPEDMQTASGPAMFAMIKFLTVMAATWNPAAAATTRLPGMAITGTKLAKGARLGVSEMSKRGIMTHGAINGTMADMLVEAEPNLFNGLDAAGVELGGFSEFMATSEEDPEVYNRLRNSLFGAGFGALTDGIMLGVRGLRAGMAVRRSMTDDQLVYDSMTKAGFDPTNLARAIEEGPGAAGLKAAAANDSTRDLSVLVEAGFDVDKVLKAVKDGSIDPDKIVKARRARANSTKMSEESAAKISPISNDDLARAMSASSHDVKARSLAAQRILETEGRLAGITTEQATALAKEYAAEIEEGFNHFRFGAEKGTVDDAIAKVLGADFDAITEGRHVRGYLGIIEEEAKGGQPLGLVEVLSRVDGEIWDGAKSTKARNLLKYMSERTDELLRIAERPDATEVEIWAWRRQKITTAAVMERVLNLTAEHGRVLNASKVIASSDGLRMRADLNRVLEQGGGVEQLRELAKREGEMLRRGIKPANRHAKLTKGEEISNGLSRIAIAGMLFQPVSHFKNGLGLATTFMLEPMERAIGRARRLALGEGADEGVEAGEAYMLLKGQTLAFADAWRAAGKAWRTGESEFGSLARQKLSDLPGDPQGHGAFKPAFPMADSDTAYSGAINLMARLGNKVARVNDFSARVLMLEDEFAKVLGHRGELYSLAMNRAQRELRANADVMGPKLRVAAYNADGTVSQVDPVATNLAARVKYLIDNPLPGDDLAAVQQANYRTLTDKSTSLPSRKTQELRNWSDSPGGQYFVTTQLMPFVNTPMRAASYTLERLHPGLGRLSKTYKDNLAKGGRDRDIAFGRMAMGAMTFATFYNLAMDGRLAPPRPIKDQAKAKAFSDAGGYWGGIYVSEEFGWADTRLWDGLTPQMGLAGALAEMQRNKDIHPEHELAIADYLAASILVASELTYGRTYFKGLTRAMDFVGGDMGPREIATYTRAAAQVALPFSGLAKATERMWSPEIEKPSGFPGETFDWVSSMTAGLSDMLPDNYNTVGEKINRDPRWGAWSSFHGQRATPEKGVHPIFIEMERLDMQIGNIPMKTSLPGVGGDGFDFTDHPRAYEWLARNSGDGTVKFGMGRTLNEALRDLVVPRINPTTGKEDWVGKQYRKQGKGEWSIERKQKHIRALVNDYRENTKDALINFAETSDEPWAIRFYDAWLAAATTRDPDSVNPLNVNREKRAPFIAPEIQ